MKLLVQSYAAAGLISLALSESLEDHLSTYTTDVEELHLSGMGLTGYIPSSLASLTNLRHLDLGNNDLEGSITWTSFSTQALLTHLDLSNNDLTGSIPSSIFNLMNLEYAYLDTNEWGSSFPQFVTTSLKELDLYKCGLTGSLPSTLYMLTNLEYLRIHENEMTGSISTQLGLLTNLQLLDFADNELTGTVPTALSTLTNLYKFKIDENGFTGTLPEFPSTFPGLKYLELEENDFTGTLHTSFAGLTEMIYFDVDNCELTGTIPSEYAAWTNLEYLMLDDNDFTGTIPEEFANFVNLEEFDIDDNKLTGTFPSFLTSLTKLTAIEMYKNDFTGTLPSDVFHHENLVRMYIGQNDFTGPLPDSVYMPELTALSIKDNEHTGTIPEAFYSLTTLIRFELQDNDLTGTISNSLSNLGELSRLDVQDNKLVGTMPDLSALTSLENFDVADNKLTGPLPTTWANLPLLTSIRAHENDFTGTIAQGVFSDILERFSVYDNAITGTIPSVVGFASSLTALYLADNRLTGTIPSLADYVPLSDASFDNNCLSGTVPSLNGASADVSPGDVLSGTCSPTGSPTGSPTTLEPTVSPTTLEPTSSPSAAPTASPTVDIPTMDMFFLLDKSASLGSNANNKRCPTVSSRANSADELTTGWSCWELFVNFVQATVDEILANPGTKMAWAQENNVAALSDFTQSNFRVQLNAFACTDKQYTPLTFQWGGDLMATKSAFDAAMQEMRLAGVPKKAGSCPGQAVERIMTEAENRINLDYADVPSENGRATFKTMVIITDGIFYDGDRATVAAEKIRDTLDMGVHAVGVYVEKNAKKKQQQLDQLDALTGNSDNTLQLSDFDMDAFVDGLVDRILDDLNTNSVTQPICDFGSPRDELTSKAMSTVNAQGQSVNLLTAVSSTFETRCTDEYHVESCKWIPELLQCMGSEEPIPCTSLSRDQCGSYSDSCYIKKKKCVPAPVPTPAPTQLPTTRVPTVQATESPGSIEVQDGDECGAVNILNKSNKKKKKICKRTEGCAWASNWCEQEEQALLETTARTFLRGSDALLVMNQQGKNM